MREPFARRWWIYQRERFPIFAHGALIAAFSFSAVAFSALLRGEPTLPAPRVLLVAFLNSFLSFLQLRLADEFKDFEEDRRFRPYRAVPRGLVTLRELGWLWLLTGFVQALLALWLDARLLGLLVINWTYLALMSREFFVRDWIKRRPITYLWTHMLIMPLIDFYATACDWLPTAGRPPQGLFWFVIVSFFNGVVIEVGRKIRSPDREEVGVATYSALWGMKRATGVWLALMVVTAGSAGFAGRLIQFQIPVLATLGLLWLAGLALAVAFHRQPAHRQARWFEPASGAWTIALYLVLGAVPLLVRMRAGLGETP